MSVRWREIILLMHSLETLTYSSNIIHKVFFCFVFLLSVRKVVNSGQYVNTHSHTHTGTHTQYLRLVYLMYEG